MPVISIFFTGAVIQGAYYQLACNESSVFELFGVVKDNR